MMPLLTIKPKNHFVHLCYFLNYFKDRETFIINIFFLKKLVVVHFDDVVEFLTDEVHQDTIFDIMLSIANQIPITIEPYLCWFEKAEYFNSFKVCKIISTVGKALKSKSEYCTKLLIKRLAVNSDKHVQILKEINNIATLYPNVIGK
jgi:hypothetical protein